jgi:hypothetical protein
MAHWVERPATGCRIGAPFPSRPDDVSAHLTRGRGVIARLSRERSQPRPSCGPPGRSPHGFRRKGQDPLARRGRSWSPTTPSTTVRSRGHHGCHRRLDAALSDTLRDEGHPPEAHELAQLSVGCDSRDASPSERKCGQLRASQGMQNRRMKLKRPANRHLLIRRSLVRIQPGALTKPLLFSDFGACRRFDGDRPCPKCVPRSGLRGADFCGSSLVS